MVLGGSGARVFVSLWRSVAPCGTGVVAPKERLLQSQLLQPKLGDLYAVGLEEPKLGDLYAVGLEAGIDWSDCRLQAGAGGIPCLEGCSLTL